MTSLTFHLARALGRQFVEGDEIVVTELDHHGNVDTWRSLEKDRGVVIRVLPFDPESGELDLAELPGLLNDRTRLVAIGAASNAIGTITDVAEVCRMAREAGARQLVITHRWPQVREATSIAEATRSYGGPVGSAAIDERFQA